MTAALWLLGIAAVGLGVFPTWVIDHIAAPAASSLLHTGAYTRAVLAGAAKVPQLHLAFSYFEPQALATVAISVALGLALAAVYMRISEPNGSVNDYAAFAVVGVLCALAVLAS